MATAILPTAYSTIKIPADNPGQQLAKTGVGIGVGGAGNRNGAGEFGVAQRGKPAGHGRKHKQQTHRRATRRGGLANGTKQPRANDGGYPQQHQIAHPQVLAQPTAGFKGTVVFGLAHNMRDAFPAEERAFGHSRSFSEAEITEKYAAFSTRKAGFLLCRLSHKFLMANGSFCNLL